MASLAPAQVAAGHDVQVVGIFPEAPDGHPFWDSLRSSGVATRALVVRGRGYRAERRGVVEALAAHGSEILHTHGYRPDVVDAPAARARGVATVSTVHGFTGGGWRNRLYEWMQRRAFRRFDAVVAVSERLRGELAASGVPVERLHTVRNAWQPVDPPLPRDRARAAMGLPASGPVVGWIGRLTGEKAPDVMLSALAHLPDGTRLAFVGDGPMRQELEAAAAAGGWADRVSWVGAVPGAGRMLQAFDAVAISSWTEGTPMVLLEAMAAGVPLVSTAVGGIPDVVSDAEAVLVPAGRPEALAEGLGRMLAGGSAVEQRVGAARSRLEREFALGPWVERYRVIYEGCLRP